MRLRAHSFLLVVQLGVRGERREPPPPPLLQKNAAWSGGIRGGGLFVKCGGGQKQEGRWCVGGSGIGTTSLVKIGWREDGRADGCAREGGLRRG